MLYYYDKGHPLNYVADLMKYEKHFFQDQEQNKINDNTTSI